VTPQLLIAEDDPSIAQAVAFGAQMTWPGCRVTVATDGTEALGRFAADRPDLVVLDVEIPPPDGFTVCRRIREISSSVLILMLTVRTSRLDKVRALDLGADDYLTKPFDHLELLARLRALLRRTQREVEAARAPLTVGVTVGDITLDTALRTACVRGCGRWGHGVLATINRAVHVAPSVAGSARAAHAGPRLPMARHLHCIAA
jgi:DNA-binding response OmpR family regulator